MEYIQITWPIFDNIMQRIAENYSDKNIKKIIGISRGGLIPGVTLSHLLNIPFTSIKWQTRDGEIRDTKKLLSLINLDSSSTLFIDDICDSGRTIREISQLTPDSIWTTMITKNKDLVDFSPLVLETDKWVIFPWETPHHKAIIN